MNPPSRVNDLNNNKKLRVECTSGFYMSKNYIYEITEVMKMYSFHFHFVVIICHNKY